MTTRGLGVGGLGTMPLGGDDDRALANSNLAGAGAISPATERERIASTQGTGVGGGTLGTMSLGGGTDGMAGVGLLAGETVLNQEPTVTLEGAGSVTADTERHRAAAPSLAGAGTLTPSPDRWRYSSITMDGTGTITATYGRIIPLNTRDTGLGNGGLGTMPLGGSAAEGMIGQGTLSAEAVFSIEVTTSLIGAGDLTTDALIDKVAAAALEAAGVLASDAERWREAATITDGELGSSELGTAPLGGKDGLEGRGTITVDTIRDRTADVSLEGAGVLSLFAGFANWKIDGQSITSITDEIREWDGLTLTFQTDVSTVTNHLRALDGQAGKVELIERADGGFIAVDRADGDNTYAVSPPVQRQPLRVDGDFLVDEYDEEVSDQQGDHYEVTLQLIPDADRETTNALAETADAGEWTFEFDTGTIATSRVSAELDAVGKNGTPGKRLTLILDNDQATVLEESASKLAAVRIREVPDGDNVAEDNSEGDTNTVTVSSPDTDTFPDGSYVVQEWETTMQNNDWQRVRIFVKSA